MRLVPLARRLQVAARLALVLFLDFGAVDLELEDDAFCHLNVNDSLAHGVLRDRPVVAQLADEGDAFGVQFELHRVFVRFLGVAGTQLFQSFSGGAHALLENMQFV